MNEPINIAVIIVTYNRKELLLKVISSVLNQTYPVKRIFIIDNNSEDSTFDYLLKTEMISKIFNKFENIGKFSENKFKETDFVYLKLNENLGGSGGFHYGVKISLNYDWDYLWFLDDDAKPQNNCLENLLRYSDKNRVLVPVRISREIDLREFPAIRFNMKNPFLKEVRDVEFYKNFKSYKEFPDIIEVEDFSFEGPLIKREFIEKIGLPKKDIFISGDDTDYALRILNEFKVRHLLVKDAVINRLNSEKKENKIPLWKEYYLKRNYYYTHYQYGKNIFVKTKPFFLFLFSLIKNVLYLRMSFNKFKVNFFAFFDSFKKEMPRRFEPNDFN